MAAIHELIKQVSDPALRERLEQEVKNITKDKKFGLVFEEHIPECTALYGHPIKRGVNVAKRKGNIGDVYTVVNIKKDIAVCKNRASGDVAEIPMKDLVAVALFGEAIFPVLRPIDKVQNAVDSPLWHTLIEADNYHALQLLEYLYPKNVDCIYIDPPYNTGTDDWKYNDAFVDSSDHWSHSKWLSMMKKRLQLAGKILSDQGALIISIGYQEVHRLVLLCEELFPGKQVVAVTVQTSGGKPSGGFNYLQEYLVFVVPVDFKATSIQFAGGKSRTPFEGLTLATFDQTQRPNQTYPIFVDRDTMCIVGCGKSLTERVDNGIYSGELDGFQYDYDEAPDGCAAVWPVTSKGDKCVWRLVSDRLMGDWEKGYIKVSVNKSKKNPNEYSIQYLPDGVIKKIKSGKLEVLGTEENKPTLIFGENTTVGLDVPTIWNEKSFYTSKGTSQIDDVFGEKAFPYPKPIDLIAEVIKIATKEDSVVLDFFAGSGTTLNAVNLLNEQDGYNRRCIIVTNNELSKKQTKALLKAGETPGSEKWESNGICRAVTWPRTKYTILGKRENGEELEGEYGFFSDDENRRLSDGFEANVEYFRLGFVDKNSVSLGRQFKQILPLLWLKSGAKGARPELDDDAEDPDMMICPENEFAVLVDETRFGDFSAQVNRDEKIKTVYLVTNSDEAFREMNEGIKADFTYQLYRDYVDNFSIGGRRNLG